MDWDTALDAAAELIAGATRPLFYGWSETSIECMKEGFKTYRNGWGCYRLTRQQSVTDLLSKLYRTQGLSPNDPWRG